MTSRERILSAIGHRQPDKLPVDIGATPSSGVSMVAYQNLVQHLGRSSWENRVYDVIQQVTQPSDEFLSHFGIDVVDVGRFFNTAGDYWQRLELIKGYPALYPRWFNPERQPDGSWLAPGKTGEYIGKMPVGATFFDQLIFPYLEGYPEVFSDFGREQSRVIWGGFGFTPFDWLDQPDFWNLLRETILREREKSDKAFLIGIGCNLFEWGTFLRRIDNFLTDLYLEPANVHRLLDKLLSGHMELIEKICNSVGDIVDIIKFGDDLGTNNGPFMPAETYNEFFAPRHKIMCDYVKAHSSAHTMLHVCGGIYELIPGLINSGFEIINPVQINAVNMEPEKLKREFGKDVTFWGGGCNTQSILNHATPQKVRDHVRKNIEIFGRDGGFVFTTVHNILPDVPPENIMAMFEAVDEFRG